MSTRANIVFKQGENSLVFYRHSDGYPEGVFDTLKKFISLLRNKKIRDNVSQSAGWLVLIGAEEYGTTTKIDKNFVEDDPFDYCWKSGSYEIAFDVSRFVDYIYVIDYDESPIKCYYLDEKEKFSLWKHHYKEKEFDLLNR